jgi:hypothetical protein
MGGGRRGARGDYARLEAFLTEVGLPMPPMPEMAEARLKERGEWWFSTRTFKESPENLMHYVRKAIGGASPDYVLVARTGQEPDGTALHYYLLQGPLQLFLRVAWVGAGPKAEPTNARVRGCLDLAHELVAAVPSALRRGLLERSGRITVVATDVGDSFWETAVGAGGRPQGDRPSRRGSRNLPGPREVLTEAIRWCRGESAEGRRR